MFIEGVVTSIIFRNEDNGYTVARFLSEEEEFTIVGNSPFIYTKEHMELEGDWTYHGKYGEQFAFRQVHFKRPKDRQAIVGYLSSGLIPYLGPKTAEKIVDHFGDQTLEILEKDPDRLQEISGLGKKRMASIKESFLEQRELRDLLLFTQSLGLGLPLSLKIHKFYGDKTEAFIRANPYQLADDIQGIGFLRADQIATSLGYDPQSSFRKQAALKYTLREALADGHTYLPVDLWLEKTSQLLKMETEDLADELVQLAIDPKIYLTSLEGEGRAYLTPYYRAELDVAQALAQKAQIDLPQGIVEEVLKKIGDQMDFRLSDKQKEALQASLTHGALVITGGPGTGKTTTLRAIVMAMETLGLKVALGAPTGRAAKRMEEATSREAKTIHRLLQFDYGGEDFEEEYREVDQAIEADVVIIDEASMVDLLLMNNLLEGMKEDSRLVLVGDKDQLPSVGAGNVLHDIIESGILPTINLDVIFRQAESSMIVQNAHRINQGQAPLLNQAGQDFFLVRTRTGEEARDLIGDLVKTRLPHHYNLDPLEDIQVLSPMKKGPCGTESLNRLLQESLNPDQGQASLRVGDFDYRVGDKVMQTRNDYQVEWTSQSSIYESQGQGVFNGDLGHIIQIDPEEGEVTVLFDDWKEVQYDRSNLDQIMPAYAFTVHKSQGSEFPLVVMPMVGGPPMLLTRNLLYTGITRAKSLVVLVGEEKVLDRMIKNNRINKRYSGLKDQLLNYKTLMEEDL
ncbi:MAG: ATP-dependent RecD-like DNA helicase [Tissierellia bacterium]|nr:ATP-dependent RecD-like DNA helicase [Tissierellia bacterium]